MPSRKVKANNPEPCRLPRPHKLKRIRKLSGLHSKHSPSTPSHFSTPHRLPANSLPTCSGGPLRHQAHSMVSLVRNLNEHMGYAQDTYLACLRLLQQLKFQTASMANPTPSPKLVAAATVALTAKVHEYRTPKFTDLMVWGSQEFSHLELTLQEGLLLQQIGYAVPAVLECETMKEMQRTIENLERSLSAPAFVFQ